MRPVRFSSTATYCPARPIRSRTQPGESAHTPAPATCADPASRVVAGSPGPGPQSSCPRRSGRAGRRRSRSRPAGRSPPERRSRRSASASGRLHRDVWLISGRYPAGLRRRSAKLMAPLPVPHKESGMKHPAARGAVVCRCALRCRSWRFAVPLVTAGIARAEGSAGSCIRRTPPAPRTRGAVAAARTSNGAPMRTGRPPARRRAAAPTWSLRAAAPLMDSSAVAVGAGDILVYDPGVETDTDVDPLPPITTGVTALSCSAPARGAAGSPRRPGSRGGRQDSRAPRRSSGTRRLRAVLVRRPHVGVYGVVFYRPSARRSGRRRRTGETDLAAAANFDATRIIHRGLGRDRALGATSTTDSQPASYRGTDRLHRRQRAADRPRSTSSPSTASATGPTRAASTRTGSPSSATSAASWTATARPALPRRVRHDGSSAADRARGRRHVRRSPVPDLLRRPALRRR